MLFVTVPVFSRRSALFLIHTQSFPIEFLTHEKKKNSDTFRRQHKIRNRERAHNMFNLCTIWMDAFLFLFLNSQIIIKAKINEPSSAPKSQNVAVASITQFRMNWHFIWARKEKKPLNRAQNGDCVCVCKCHLLFPTSYVCIHYKRVHCEVDVYWLRMLLALTKRIFASD